MMINHVKIDRATLALRLKVDPRNIIQAYGLRPTAQAMLELYGCPTYSISSCKAIKRCTHHCPVYDICLANLCANINYVQQHPGGWPVIPEKYR